MTNSFLYRRGFRCTWDIHSEEGAEDRALELRRESACRERGQNKGPRGLRQNPEVSRVKG